MNDKKLLAIETSGELCSVCIAFSPSKYDERNILMKHIHSEKLVPMIEKLLNSNQISTDQLDCVAVSVGPGSFTGLRIGMTVAKAIAFASKLPIVPVPTYSALSFEIFEYLPNNTTFAIINNANIEEVYYAEYKCGLESPEIINGVNLLDKSEINEQIKNTDVIFGNLKSIENIRIINSPRAVSIAKWTYLFGEDLLTFEYDYLEPNYLKQIKFKKMS